ncbi:MAG: hypothetical protein IJU51_07590 [Clostridia bacterium]|nr:hypothetical protein [Clostridia bacterium]
MSDFSERILQALGEDENLSGCRIIRAYSPAKVGYPLKEPVICVSREECDRIGFLLGSEDCIFGSEKLTVSVASDESKGGAFCEELARSVCRAVLEHDGGREIVSVSVEKCMYDRSLFAYKVIMGFTLREGYC